MTDNIPERILRPAVSPTVAKNHLLMELRNLPNKMMDNAMLKKYENGIKWQMVFNEWVDGYYKTYVNNYKKFGKQSARKKAMDQIRKLDISN